MVNIVWRLAHWRGRPGHTQLGQDSDIGGSGGDSRGHLLQHYTGPMPPAGDVPDEAEEVGGLGEDGEVEEDEALLHGGLPLHAGSLRAADHRYNK